MSLSFNGKDPIVAEDHSSLSSLGIVNGDLLVVIPATSSSIVNKDKEIKEQKSNTSSQNLGKNTNKVDRNMCTSNVKVCSLLEAKDGVPPPSVFENFEKYSPSSASEAINILVHINMLEAGFVLGESPPNATKTLPLSWNEMAATLKYHHPGFQNFDCTIVIVTMGDIKQVLASFSGQDSEISIRLEMKEYLSSSQILPHRLTKVAQLARILRNKLLYPLQVAAHLTLGLAAPWHLAGLPQEILVTIFSMLNIRSVLDLSMSSKRLNEALKDKKIWYNLFKRDFADHFHPSETISGADWKEKYKTQYAKQKELNQSAEDKRFILEEPLPRQPFSNPAPSVDPFNPYMPQPRGGPYYPPQPDPQPSNPFWDPDSPYFGGEIPHPSGPFPRQPNPLDPFGGMNPRRPNNPLQPPFMPPQPGPRRGPRFNFF